MTKRKIEKSTPSSSKKYQPTREFILRNRKIKGQEILKSEENDINENTQSTQNIQNIQNIQNSEHLDDLKIEDSMNNNIVPRDIFTHSYSLEELLITFPVEILDSLLLKIKIKYDEFTTLKEKITFVNRETWNIGSRIFREKLLESENHIQSIFRVIQSNDNLRTYANDLLRNTSSKVQINEGENVNHTNHTDQMNHIDNNTENFNHIDNTINIYFPLSNDRENTLDNQRKILQLILDDQKFLPKFWNLFPIETLLKMCHLLGFSEQSNQKIDVIRALMDEVLLLGLEHLLGLLNAKQLRYEIYNQIQDIPSRPSFMKSKNLTKKELIINITGLCFPFVITSFYNDFEKTDI